MMTGQTIYMDITLIFSKVVFMLNRVTEESREKELNQWKTWTQRTIYQISHLNTGKELRAMRLHQCFGLDVPLFVTSTVAKRRHFDEKGNFKKVILRIQIAEVTITTH